VTCLFSLRVVRFRDVYLADGARMQAERSSCSSLTICAWLLSRSAPCLRIALVTGIMRLSYVMHRHAVKGIAFLACGLQVVHTGLKSEGHARARVPAVRDGSSGHMYIVVTL
jgi:hypothetical protein